MRRIALAVVSVLTWTSPEGAAAAQETAPQVTVGRGCSVIVDVSGLGDPTLTIQRELNVWNDWSDADHNEANDGRHVCVTGTMNLDARSARRRSYERGGISAPAPLAVHLAIAPTDSRTPGCGIDRSGNPIACATSRTHHRSEPLILEFVDLVVRYDRSVPQSLPTAFLQIGDGWLNGSQAFREQVQLRGNLHFIVRGDGDKGAREFTVPAMSADSWIDDPSTFVVLYYDGAVRVEQSDFNPRIEAGEWPNTDYRTVGILSRQAFSKHFTAGIVDGMGVGYWQMGVENAVAAHHLIIRENTIGFQIGDPANGCAEMSFAKNPGGETTFRERPCNGLLFSGLWEGNAVGLVLFGGGGRIAFIDAYEERPNEVRNHGVVLGAGVNSATGEICAGDVDAGTQSEGATCRTVASPDGRPIRFGRVVFSGGSLGSDRGHSRWDALVIGAAFDGELVFSDGIKIGTQTSGKEQDLLFAYAGRPRGARVHLGDFWLPGERNARLPRGFPGRVYFESRTFQSTSCEQEFGRRNRLGDICVEPPSGVAWRCLPKESRVFCDAPGDWSRAVSSDPG